MLAMDGILFQNWTFLISDFLLFTTIIHDYIEDKAMKVILYLHFTQNSREILEKSGFRFLMRNPRTSEVR